MNRNSRRDEVLDFYRRRLETVGTAPSCKEAGDAIGMSAVGVWKHVQTLIGEGKLEESDGARRGRPAKANFKGLLTAAVMLLCAPVAAIAADTKISAETSASTLDGTELLPVVQGGANRKATTAQVKTYAQTGLAPIASSGSATDLSIGTIPAARLPVFDSVTKGAVPASGGGTINFLRADGSWVAPPSGGGGTGPVISSGYTMTTARLLGRTTAATGAIEELTAASAKSFLAISSSDVSGLATIATSGSGADLSANSVTLGKIATQATGTVLGNVSGSTAAPSALTAAQVTALVQSGVSTQAGTAYTAALGDANGYIRFTNASAVTVTVPPNSAVAFPIGTELEVEQAGAGIITIAAGAGVTVNVRGADFTTAGQYAVVAVKKVATDTGTLTGDL